MKTKKNIKKKILKYFVHCIKPTQPIKNLEFIHIDDFIKKTKANSVEEIFLGDVLDYYKDIDILSLLKDIVNKLTVNGVIYIQSTDIKALCHNYLYGQISLSIFKNMIFGDNKKNTISVYEMKNFLSNIGNIEIHEIKFINTIQYFIKCIKND